MRKISKRFLMKIIKSDVFNDAMSIITNEYLEIFYVRRKTPFFLLSIDDNKLTSKKIKIANSNLNSIDFFFFK